MPMVKREGKDGSDDEFILSHFKVLTELQNLDRFRHKQNV